MKALGHLRLTLLFVMPLLGISCSTRSSTEAIRELEARNSILLSGHVIRQGIFSLAQAPKSLSVSGAIVHFGQGFAANADARHVILRRGLGRDAQRIIVDAKGILTERKREELDPSVQAGDIIIVNDPKGAPENANRAQANQAQQMLMLRGARRNAFLSGPRFIPVRCSPRAGGARCR